jgi:putative aldouronate transport system permease protein
MLKKPSFSVVWKKYRLLYIMLFPGLAAMFIFHYIPIYGIVIAFQDFKILRGVTGSEWVGLRNFARLFSYIGVWKAVRNSFVISLYGLAAGFPLTILFALIINEIRQRHLKRVFQTISYLPHFLSWIIVSRFVMSVLSPASGIINQLIKSLGGSAVFFIAEPAWFRSILIISSLWKGIGWGSIVYLAAISNADVELYDAAYVDGAGRFRMAWYITIPAMYPVITISLIMSVSGLLGGSFEQIYNLLTSPTMEVGDVISTFVYRLGFEQMDYSASTAIGLLNNLIAMTLLIIANTIAKRFSDYTLW